MWGVAYSFDYLGETNAILIFIKSYKFICVVIGVILIFVKSYKFICVGVPVWLSGSF